MPARVGLPRVGVVQIAMVEAWMDLETASAYCGFENSETLRRHAANGDVGSKVGSLWRFKREDLDDWIRGK